MDEMISDVRRAAGRLARQTMATMPPRLQYAARQGIRKVRARRSRRSQPTALVSLVVPVYNVERYLPACLDSLLDQTYPHLQIIAVDDGSPDGSIDILQAYAARDSRLEIIRQANAGLGAARNVGAKAARGEYLMFIDSDDTLHLEAIQTFVNALHSSGSDFAVASYQRINSAGTSPAAWWIRRAHAQTRLSTDLVSFPDIQVNAVAWSKCYRRTFWVANQFAFPVGVLYEDQAVSAQAYVTARSFDVLSRVLYNWRVRDDRSSITQQTAEVKDLQARLDAAFASLEQLSRPGYERSREVRLAQYLSNDFPLSIRSAQHGDQEFWDLLRSGLTTLTAQITPYVWGRVSAQQRVATRLVIEDLREEAAWFVGFGHNNPKNFPSVVHDGKVYLDLSVRHALGMELTDPLLALADHQLDLQTSIRRAFWNADGELQLEGWAYIDNLDLTSESTQIKAWCQLRGTERRVELPVEQVRNTEVTAISKHRFANYEKSGFVLRIDPRQLLGDGEPASSDWQVVVEVTSAGVVRTAALRALDRGSSAGRLVTRFLGEVQATPNVGVRDGFLVELRPVRTIVEHADLTDQALSVTVKAVDGFAPMALELGERATGQLIREPLTRLASRGAEGSLVVPELGGAEAVSTVWNARVVSLAGIRSPAALVEADAIVLPPVSSPYAARTRHGNLAVYDEPRSVWVERAEMTPDGALTVTGTVIGLPVERLVVQVTTPRAHASAPATPTGPGRFEVTVPLRHDPWQLGETVLPIGRYRLTCAEQGLDGSVETPGEIPVHVDQGLIDTLPVSFATDRLRGQLRLVGGDKLLVVLDAPLTDEVRGARHQQSRQDATLARIGDPDFEFGSVLFRSYYGEVAACNPLAVHTELRRRGTKHTLYWAVQDYSVQVPEGGIPVIHESDEWYRLLHDAHFYMDNMHQALYHRKPAHQIQIQTFHGYPFKQMGQSNWAWQNRDRAHIESYLERARDWDYLVSPASYGTKALCEEFGFPNEVLEIGYPRNDVLLSPKAPAIAEQVRERLGIRADQIVLLYGPTFRDELATNDFKASMVDFLDIPRLAGELGDQYVVLIRGHAFNARLAVRFGSAGNVIDVTDYPNVADLCLASDAAILDYSSLRFDYALTGKPMIFMVPDLENYVATSRGALFAFEPTAPGPQLRTTQEVIDAASDLAAVRRDYADAYATFRRDFLDLDDGHATERLVDRVFMVDGL